MKDLKLDRAFPPTPDCVHAAIERGFRRARRRERLKRGLLGAVSIAAALMLAIGLVSASRLRMEPRRATPDLQVAVQPKLAPQSEAPSGGARSAAASSAPSPTPSPEPAPTAPPEAEYTDAPLEENAAVAPLEMETELPEFEAADDVPLEMEAGLPEFDAADDVPLEAEADLAESEDLFLDTAVLSDAWDDSLALMAADGHNFFLSWEDFVEAPEEGFKLYPGVVFYYTEAGTYCHLRPDCSGMENAELHDPLEAMLAGKKLCPECILKDMEVYYAEYGSYCHLYPNNSTMPATRPHSYAEAVAAGKAPCELCIARLVTVFYTEKGQYCHTSVNCSGMENAEKHTLDQAYISNHLPCPICMAGGGESPLTTATAE